MGIKIFFVCLSIIMIASAIAFIARSQKMGIYDSFNNNPALQASSSMRRKMLYYSGVPLLLFILGGVFMLIAVFL